MLVSYDDARTFLVKVAPWPAEGEEGYVNLHWSKKADDGKRLIWQGRAYKSVADAVGFIQWISTQQSGMNFYVCMSSQKNAEKKISAKGFEYLKAIRLHENKLLFKAIWLDLDFKGYPSEVETMKAFGEFVLATKLPAPSIYVGTGGGLHIYWTFSEPLTYEGWHPLALALAEAAKRHGLKADVQCTTDSVRILRIPDTFNYKYTPPRRVRFITPPKDFDYLVERVAIPLGAYRVAAPAEKPPENDLSAGIGAFAPVDVARVLPNCPHLQESLRSHGAAHSQPLWAMNALLSTFSVQGRALFHLLSNGHPEYTRESSDEIYDRKERERKTKNIGWPTCASIERAGSTSCSSCPHRTENKSPLHFTKPAGQVNGHHAVSNFVVASESNIQYLPPSYKHTEDMRVRYIDQNDEGMEVEVNITNWPMHDGWLEVDGNGLQKLHFTTELNNQPKIVTMPTSIAGVKNKLRECLQGQGLEIEEWQLKPVGVFTVAWFKELREHKVFKGSTSYGWNASETNELAGFSYGGQLWRPSGHISASAVSSLDAEYSPVGKLEAWQEAAQLVTEQDRNELNAILATSFGAPLVRFTGQAAFLISAYSLESGIGKTTAMKVAQAVWGHPTKAMQSLSDTSNSVFHKLGQTHSLPLYWDEMRVSAANRQAIEFLLQLTSGREKGRLDNNAQAREVRAWNTILVCASNDSLMDFVASGSNTSAAAMNRVIEFLVAPGEKGQISIPKASKIVASLEANYGQAGYKYAQFLGNNFKAIESEMQESLEEIAAEVDAKVGERFWLASISCLLLGAKYAEQLGLMRINTNSLRTFLLNNFSLMRGDRDEQVVDFKHNDVDVAQVVAQFISDIGSDRILRTNKIFRRAGRVEMGEISLTGGMPRNTPLVQIASEENAVRVNYSQFEKWLQKNTKFADNYRSVIKQIVAHSGVTKLKARIGAGCNMMLPQETMLDFDANKLDDLKVNDGGNMEAAASNVVLFNR